MNRQAYQPQYLMALCLVLVVTIWPAAAWADGPVARAVLFYSPTCAYCHQVISEVIVPLMEKYGDRLEVVGANVADLSGQALYQAAIKRYNIPSERIGVPTLVIGETVLVGATEIPQLFPSLIEKHLAQGGVGWPAIPGLTAALTPTQSAPTTTPLPPTPTTQPVAVAPVMPAATSVPPVAQLPQVTASSADLRSRIAKDPLGNGLAIGVLVAMTIAVAWVAVTFRAAERKARPRWQEWAVPVLAVIGLGVAAYLAYVETRQVTAVCGPVGDCNAVQQSAYARLFGLVPVAVLGLAGYVAILAAWIAGRYGPPRLGKLAKLALFAMTVFGTLFSIYLTFLEPFVIGATCSWCLTSAVIMTALMLLSAGPAFSTLTSKSQAVALRRKTPSRRLARGKR